MINVIYFFQKNWKLIIVGLLVLWFLFSLKQCSDIKELKREKEVLAHNIDALSDSIRVTKDRTGQEEYNKLSLLVTKVEELEKSNSELFKEVKETKGKVSQISKIGVQIVHDTVPLIVKAELVDSVLTNTFSFDTVYSPGNFNKLKGFTKYDFKNGKSFGELTQHSIGVKIITGIKNLDKNKPEIFVRSDYPGFSVTELEGAVLDKNLFTKKKIPLVTFGGSIGWNPVAYDFKSGKFDFNASKIGATLGLNINLGKR
jgi:hypothetical protein